jgi:DnaJ-class molecular chaperone
MFTEIGNAYEILSTERRQYDQLLRSPFGRGGFQHNFYRPQQHWQQQHWQQRRQDGSPFGGLMGMLVPLGILVYMLNSQFNGGGAAAPRSGNKKKAADDDDDKEEERTPPSRFPKGTRVQVQGLQSAAAAVLNGTRGGVVRPLLDLSHFSSTTLSLRAKNHVVSSSA